MSKHPTSRRGEAKPGPGLARQWCVVGRGAARQGEEMAAACAAADVERVRVIRERERDEEQAWALAAREYHKERAGRTLIVETEPKRLARLRELLADDVSINRVWAELSKPHIPIATLQAAEFLIPTGDSEQLRRWLALHSAQERIAIRKHLEATRCRSRPSK